MFYLTHLVPVSYPVHHCYMFLRFSDNVFFISLYKFVSFSKQTLNSSFGIVLYTIDTTGVISPEVAIDRFQIFKRLIILKLPIILVYWFIVVFKFSIFITTSPIQSVLLFNSIKNKIIFILYMKKC